ncbi:hypothetical protein NC652_037056 [Populus alba x Populus x berolinensis]|uniref:Uncharacterized protein n=2 Tax=Populus TaxID=3689 RepID=A0ACC4AV75_POPAL|nr:hypothetical protein NC652_037056 [Populus alba x Populus x berolinensis]KAJ6969134.1 hypothetical protein NC653_036944 [Populus alba x Populus x berolinensis]
MSKAVANAVGHGFTFDVDKITKNYSADCISWNPTKHKEGGDDGSWTVQKGMSQEINLTETIHELPEEWACICSEQEEDDGFIPYCQPSHGHLSRAMASPIWTMMKQ